MVGKGERAKRKAATAEKTEDEEEKMWARGMSTWIG